MWRLWKFWSAYSCLNYYFDERGKRERLGANNTVTCYNLYRYFWFKIVANGIFYQTRSASKALKFKTDRILWIWVRIYSITSVQVDPMRPPCERINFSHSTAHCTRRAILSTVLADLLLLRHTAQFPVRPVGLNFTQSLSPINAPWPPGKCTVLWGSQERRKIRFIRLESPPLLPPPHWVLSFQGFTEFEHKIAPKSNHISLIFLMSQYSLTP